MKRKKADKWFLLNGKRIWIIIVSAFASMVFHNMFYGIFKDYFDSHGGDEPFFFILTFVIIIYFLVCLIYTLIKMIKNKTIFEKRFVIRIIMASILGALAILLTIKFNLINSEMIFMLIVIFIIFTTIFYSLIKYLGKKR